MLKRIPIVPTLLVLLAVGVMVRLGFWQLDRLHQKEALLARYSVAAQDTAVLSSDDPHPWFRNADDYFYRRAEFSCRSVVGWEAVAGKNARGETGYVHIAHCTAKNIFALDNASDRLGDIVLGWSNRPENPIWTGGSVIGIVAHGGKLGFRLVADSPQAGLEVSARPDPKDLPNNHLSYAVQWFLFALTALAIYALALRKRLQE